MFAQVMTIEQLKQIVEQLKRIADALDRAFPILPSPSYWTTTPGRNESKESRDLCNCAHDRAYHDALEGCSHIHCSCDHFYPAATKQAT